MARNKVVLLWLLMLPPMNMLINLNPYPPIEADTMPSVCGQPLLAARIVGGQNAQIGAWPWQVSISTRGSHFCGGALVAKQWVLSAAHCFFNRQNSDIAVTVGESQLENRSHNAQTIQVTQIMLNNKYSGIATQGDIALLWLQKPLDYTASFLPVCVPDASANFSEGADCWVTGWGSIKSGVPLPSPKILQAVKVPLISTDQCNELYNTSRPNSNGSTPVLEDMICAGYIDGKKDSCQGDSGGPLVCSLNDSWFVVGIVSWGEGCAKPYRPGVYTRVMSYADWLQWHVPDLQFGVVPITISGERTSFCLFTVCLHLISSLSLFLAFMG